MFHIGWPFNSHNLKQSKEMCMLKIITRLYNTF